MPTLSEGVSYDKVPPELASSAKCELCVTPHDAAFMVTTQKDCFYVCASCMSQIRAVTFLSNAVEHAGHKRRFYPAKRRADFWR